MAYTVFMLLSDYLYSFGDLFRMVYQQLAMVHFREDFYLHFGAQLLQVLHLRLGDEGLQRAVPEVDIGPVDSSNLLV